MEMIKVPKKEYEEMLIELNRFREIQDIDWNLVKQFKDSLNDVKLNKITKVA